MTWFQLVFLLVAFGGIALVIKGGQDNSMATIEEGSWLLTLALLMNPLAIAVGNIAMRSMRKMPELVVSSYMNITLGVLSTAIVFISGDDLKAWNAFDWFDWLMVGGLSTFVLFSQTFRFKAYKEYETSKLQSLTFLIPMYQFVADLALFGATFTWL